MEIEKFISRFKALLPGIKICFLNFRKYACHLKTDISEADAKQELISQIELFFNEKILMAKKEIINSAWKLIKHDDHIIIYGYSGKVIDSLIEASKNKIQFKVTIIDTIPRFEYRNEIQKLSDCDNIQCE